MKKRSKRGKEAPVQISSSMMILMSFLFYYSIGLAGINRH